MAEVELAPALESHIDRYRQSHSNAVNQALHTAGIPMLMVSCLGLLAKVTDTVVGPIPTAAVAAGAGGIYVAWDAKAAPVMATLFAGAHAVGRRLSLGTLLTMFGVGATLHAIGHYRFEHKPPAFLSRPVSVFEAPAWLLEKLVVPGKAGIGRR